MLTRRISLVLVRSAGASNNSDNAACCHVARHTKWFARAFMGRAKPPLPDTWNRPSSPKGDERARDIPRYPSMRVFTRRRSSLGRDGRAVRTQQGRVTRVRVPHLRSNIKTEKLRKPRKLFRVSRDVKLSDRWIGVSYVNSDIKPEISPSFRAEALAAAICAERMELNRAPSQLNEAQ